VAAERPHHGGRGPDLRTGDHAVRYAQTLFTVAAVWNGLTLRVEVSDASPLAPRPQLSAHPDREGGRGLFLVDAIASDWGVDVYPHGKTVWFTMSRDSEMSW
jgi:hypothetical protein